MKILIIRTLITQSHTFNTWPWFYNKHILVSINNTKGTKTNKLESMWHAVNFHLLFLFCMLILISRATKQYKCCGTNQQQITICTISVRNTQGTFSFGLPSQSWLELSANIIIFRCSLGTICSRVAATVLLIRNLHQLPFLEANFLDESWEHAVLSMIFWSRLK